MKPESRHGLIADEMQRHVVMVAHAWYGDVIGGSFRLATEFAEYLATCGVRVTYVCCGLDGQAEMRAMETIDGVEVRRYAAPDGSCSRFGRLWYHISETARIVRAISRERRIDALNGHSPLQFFGAMRALHHIPVFKNFTVHSPFEDELLSNISGKRLRFSQRLACLAARWIDGRNIRAADTVQADSRYTLDVLAKKYGRDVYRRGIVAPGWVDANRFRPIPNRQAARKELGVEWATDLPIFFTLRRLEERMGLDTLVAAARRLADEGYRFRVLIGGTGSQNDRLATLIRDAGLGECVRLLGKLPEEHLPKYYAAANCFVLPTKALECFGLIVLEAFAAGTPVIATRVAAIPELAESQGSDWMFTPGNDEELASRMADFITGRLQPSRELRGFAEGYDRPGVLQRWAELAFPAPDGLAVVRRC
jgi:glycosyltransferase involved in cell wall biosynthesis